MDAPGSLAAPRVLDGKYQLVRQLGAGGMGAVYEGLHLGTMRRVAVKVIASAAMEANAEVLARFRREAMATGAIESQHIAHVLDTGTDGETGRPYMVMEFLAGQDVEETLGRLHQLTPDLALRIVAQACIGLKKAHEQGVVHRDIKPANLFLAQRDGGERVVKLVDFGIAKLRRDKLAASPDRSTTRPGVMLGSPLYMSPEQALGKSVDHRTDLWSLGVVLYELLTGAPPHEETRTVGALIMAICQEPPKLVQDVAPWVSQDVARIVHRALALDMQARFSTANEMYADLCRLLPDGHRIDESMLAALSSEARAVVEPQILLTSAMRVPSASMASIPDAVLARAATKLAPHQTTVGFEQSDELIVLPKRDMRPAAVAVAVAAVLACAVAFVASGPSRAPLAAGLVSPAPAVVTAAVSATPAAPAPWTVVPAAASAEPVLPSTVPPPPARRATPPAPPAARASAPLPTATPAQKPPSPPPSRPTNFDPASVR